MKGEWLQGEPGWTRILDCTVFEFVNSRTGQHNSKLMISLTLFPERIRVGKLVKIILMILIFMIPQLIHFTLLRAAHDGFSKDYHTGYIVKVYNVFGFTRRSCG